MQTLFIGVPSRVHFADFWEWSRNHPEASDEVQCPECDGEGRDPDDLTEEPKDCWRCFGDGVLIGDDAARIVYTRQLRADEDALRRLGWKKPRELPAGLAASL